MKFLVAENLSKVYKKGYPDQVNAIEAIDFEIEAGSCALLSGPSGSGKTTLLSLISCLSRPTSGKYFIEGHQVSSLPERFLTKIRQEKIGIVFQHFNLIENLTVEQNIFLGLLPAGLASRQLSQRAFQAAKRVHIDHKIKSLTSNLSGGEKQRVAIARALVCDPPLICADEPTSHLDRNTSQTILEEFESLKQQGKTIIITSHDSFVQQHPIIDQRLELVAGKLV